jgi:ElaB/YqjD/DUF883 family membrane-anchored ribosome-binding protein
MDREQIRRRWEALKSAWAALKGPEAFLGEHFAHEDDVQAALEAVENDVDALLAAIDELTQQKGEMTMETFDRQAVLAKAEEVLDEARSETDRENRDSLIRLAGVYIHLAGEGRDKS